MARRKRKAGKRKRRYGELSSADALVKALSHPVRAEVLTILTERISSPKEMAAELGRKLPNVSYHVRVLDELGLIEIVKEEAVRGSVAHFYTAVEPEVVANPEWTSLSPKVRDVFSGYTVDALLSDLARSASAGILGRRENADRLVTRTPLLLDEEGWNKVRGIQALALKKILQEQVAAKDRMNGSHRGAIRAVLGQMIFEVPLEEPGEA